MLTASERASGGATAPREVTAPSLIGDDSRTRPDIPSDLPSLFDPLATSRGLLLAVSGGPDSVALLLLIDRWRRSRPIPVAVATVDHALRDGSDAEARAVAVLCAARGLPHHTLRYNGPPIRTRVQERARDARYALLMQCAAEIGADTIVTAHHADDQAETILMRLARGSALKGLAGMAPVMERGGLTIARPLLGLRKDVLAGLCREAGVAIVDDPSNTNVTYRRGALRKMTPELVAAGLDTGTLTRFGLRAARADAALRWAEQRARREIAMVEHDDRSMIDARKLAALPDELALRIVGGEIARLAPDAIVRLERLERLFEHLTDALHRNVPFAATLGGCAIRLAEGLVSIARAPSRRDTCTTRAHAIGYLSSGTLLGKLPPDA